MPCYYVSNSWTLADTACHSSSSQPIINNVLPPPPPPKKKPTREQTSNQILLLLLTQQRTLKTKNNTPKITSWKWPPNLPEKNVKHLSWAPCGWRTGRSKVWGAPERGLWHNRTPCLQLHSHLQTPGKPEKMGTKWLSSHAWTCQPRSSSTHPQNKSYITFLVWQMNLNSHPFHYVKPLVFQCLPD